MLRTRRFILSVSPALIAAFSLLMVVSHISRDFQQRDEYLFVDFEDSNEPTEETKPMNLLKDYNLHRANLISLNRNFILSSVEYRKFAIEHSLEVFIEVVTPPPEV